MSATAPKKKKTKKIYVSVIIIVCDLKIIIIKIFNCKTEFLHEIHVFTTACEICRNWYVPGCKKMVEDPSSTR